MQALVQREGVLGVHGGFGVLDRESFPILELSPCVMRQAAVVWLERGFVVLAGWCIYYRIWSCLLEGEESPWFVLSHRVSTGLCDLLGHCTSPSL
jgi:hypothetical protein